MSDFDNPEYVDPMAPVISEPAEVTQRASAFERDLEALINMHSKENESGTPDFILAAYLKGALDLFDKTVKDRANWRGERIDSIFDIKQEEKVKVVTYGGNLNMRNEIGEAEITMWPGEITKNGGPVKEVIAVFDERLVESPNLFDVDGST